MWRVWRPFSWRWRSASHRHLDGGNADGRSADQAPEERFDRTRRKPRHPDGEREAARTDTHPGERAATGGARGRSARLAGKRVAVLISGEVPDASLLREMKYLLTTAGASAASIHLSGNVLPENQAGDADRRRPTRRPECRPCPAVPATRVVRAVVTGKAFVSSACWANTAGVLFDGDTHRRRRWC